MKEAPLRKIRCPLGRYRPQLWCRRRHPVHHVLRRRGVGWLPVVSRSLARRSGCAGPCGRPVGDAASRMCSDRIASFLVGPSSLVQRLPATRVHFHGATALLVVADHMLLPKGRVGTLARNPMSRTRYRLHPGSLKRRSEVAREATLISCLSALTTTSALFPCRLLACVVPL